MINDRIYLNLSIHLVEMESFGGNICDFDAITVFLTVGFFIR